MRQTNKTNPGVIANSLCVVLRFSKFHLIWVMQREQTRMHYLLFFLYLSLTCSRRMWQENEDGKGSSTMM